jgi:hypothetical protein
MVDFAVSVQKYQLSTDIKNVLYGVVLSHPTTIYCGLKKISLKYIFHGYFEAIL